MFSSSVGSDSPNNHSYVTRARCVPNTFVSILTTCMHIPLHLLCVCTRARMLFDNSNEDYIYIIDRYTHIHIEMSSNFSQRQRQLDRARATENSSFIVTSWSSPTVYILNTERHLLLRRANSRNVEYRFHFGLEAMAVARYATKQHQHRAHDGTLAIGHVSIKRQQNYCSALLAATAAVWTCNVSSSTMEWRLHFVRGNLLGNYKHQNRPASTAVDPVGDSNCATLRFLFFLRLFVRQCATNEECAALIKPISVCKIKKTRATWSVAIWQARN